MCFHGKNLRFARGCQLPITVKIHPTHFQGEGGKGCVDFLPWSFVSFGQRGQEYSGSVLAKNIGTEAKFVRIFQR